MLHHWGGHCLTYLEELDWAFSERAYAPFDEPLSGLMGLKPNKLFGPSKMGKPTLLGERLSLPNLSLSNIRLIQFACGFHSPCGQSRVTRKVYFVAG
jgi:hypothetical protein